jgi:PLP dependent protein
MDAYMNQKNLANAVIDASRVREIKDNVHRVQERLAKAEVAAQRKEGSVQLLAATKTRDIGEIMAAIDAGVRLIGENRPQEVVAKCEGGLSEQCSRRGLLLGDLSGGESISEFHQTVGFHLIGQLQSNKINKIIECVDTVESIDSVRLADKIAQRARAHNCVIGVFLEVNESGESAKSGCMPDEAQDVAFEIAQIEGLQLRGLMTVGAHTEDERIVRAGFAHLRQLRDDIQSSGVPECAQLSMGMTNDLEYAVAEGSTEVRVGTAIFGQRSFV